MKLLYFLKYLKPFRARLLIGLACMFVVSTLGAANVLMMMPFLRVLLHEQGVEMKEEKKADPAGGEGSDGGIGLTAMLPAGLSESVSDLLAGPRAAFEEKRAAVEAWYRHETAEHPWNVLVVLSLVLALLTGIKCLAEYISKYQIAWSLYFINLSMREDIFSNLMAQDYVFFTRKSTGYLISRINSDISAMRNMITRLLNDGLQQPMTLIAMSATLVYISPQLTVVVVFLLPPIAGLLYVFSRRLRKNVTKRKKKEDQLTGSMAESLGNIRVVKTFGSESVEIAKFVKRSMELFRYAMNQRTAKFGAGPIMEFIGTLAACGVMLLGGYMILGEGAERFGRLDAESFFIYLFVLTRFYRPLKSLSTMSLRYQEARVSGERILEMLELRPEIADIENPRPFDKLTEGIELCDLTFSYDDRPVLRNVNLRLPKGKTVALVGRSGSGKTSLANLVCRLYDPTGGRILLDGHDLREYRIADLRRNMGIVTQQTILFDDTIGNNITYAGIRPGMSEEAVRERMIAAARAAYAEEFILELEGGRGYDTKIGPLGARLSGGQAQRIAIARAIFRDPQILILDEATSALDARAQEMVRRAIDNLIRDRTTLVIAHRLSTIRNADHICVLHEGEVIESGRHEELMALRGHYFGLYENEEAGTSPGVTPGPDGETADEEIHGEGVKSADPKVMVD